MMSLAPPVSVPLSDLGSGLRAEWSSRSGAGACDVGAARETELRMSPMGYKLPRPRASRMLEDVCRAAC